MIFHRSLRKELNSTAGAVLTTLFTITITVMLIRVLGQAAAGKIASQDVVALMGFEAIKLMPILLILTCFISSLLVISRWYQDSEMVVWFASGQSLLRWVRPVMRFAFPLIILTAMLSFIVTPWAKQQSLEFRQRFQNREDISRVSPGKFQESAGRDRVFFVEGISGDSTHVRNVFVRSQLPDGRTSVVVARQGTIEIDANGDKYLTMEKGRRYDGEPGKLDYQMMTFEKYNVLMAQQDPIRNVERSASALPTTELIGDPNKLNLSELVWRISLPLMALFLSLLAIPLAFVNPRGGRSANLLIALLLFVVYSNITSVFQVMVAQGKMKFAMAWWPIHVLAFAATLLMFAWRLTLNHPWHPRACWAILCGRRSAENAETGAAK